MPNEASLNRTTANGGGDHQIVNKQNINILIYTDDPERVTDGEGENFGLGHMITHLHKHEPAFARVSISLVSRNSDAQHHADNRLDRLLQSGDYDHIWFFGLHQVNKREFTLKAPGGGPRSELDVKEIAELERWMRTDGGASKGGGVLMTGDHANPRPSDALPSTQYPCCAESSGDTRLMSLGRALGRCVPRAGMLRKWEGPPTRDAKDSFSTLVLLRGTDVEAVGLQSDVVPQQLILKSFNERGEPARIGQPHPLFLYKPGEYIRVYPDHRHEGAVILPRHLDERVWPRPDSVRPRVVARGLDKRNGRRLNILAAYDGDRAGVGRIVADSTWHHYFNVNILNFPADGRAGSVIDQLGQFYANLAVWLSPLSLRQEMALTMIQWLAEHPVMFEEVAAEPDVSSLLEVGKTAYQILSQVASPCEIHELLWAAAPEAYRGQFETLYFPERGLALSPFPSKELILGAVLDNYHKGLTAAPGTEGPDARHGNGMRVAIAEGFRQAFSMQAAMIEQTWLLAQEVQVRSTVTNKRVAEGSIDSSDE